MNQQESAQQADRIRVLIVPGRDPVGDWMANVLKFEQGVVFLGLVRDLAQIGEVIGQLSPDVILVDINSGILQQGDLLSRLAAPASGAAVIVVATRDEVDMVRQTMLYGAQGFLLKPFGEAELISSVRQAHGLMVKRQAELAELPRRPSTPEAAPLSRAEIICVFSPKGGVGCTTIAINLAVALRQTTGQKTILVDGDLGFGDVDSALDITSTTSVATLLPDLDEMDDQILDRMLVSHGSGIKVLLAPPYLDAAEAIPPEQLRQLLGRLSGLGDGYVVVDTGSALDDRTLSILDACQHLLLVTTPQVTALRDAHRFLEVLKLLGYDPQKTMLVLNHCYQRGDLRLKEVERALGYPIAQTIEYAPFQVTASLNRGVPLLQEYPDSPAAQSILRLAKQLVSSRAEPEPLGQRVQRAPSRSDKRGTRRLFSRDRSAALTRVRT